MSAGDLGALFSAQGDVARWRAERENACARLELACACESRAYLLSQHEPLASLGIDREVMRKLLAFTAHHDKDRLRRELGGAA